VGLETCGPTRHRHLLLQGEREPGRMTGLPHLFPHFAFSYYHYYKNPFL
jgi:hypothetical protein